MLLANCECAAEQGGLRAFCFSTINVFFGNKLTNCHFDINFGVRLQMAWSSWMKVACADTGRSVPRYNSLSPSRRMAGMP
jgi:hypothetical protein